MLPSKLLYHKNKKATVNRAQINFPLEKKGIKKSPISKEYKEETRCT